MKKFRFLCMVLAIAVFISAMAVTASASVRSTQAYGGITQICKNNTNPLKDYAYSSITRNADLPVRNYLALEMEVQYQEGNNFYWESPKGDSGNNVEKAEVSTYRYSMMANRTSFLALAYGCDDFSETRTVTVS